MSASNNRGTVTIRDVTRIAVVMGRLGKHVSAETNSRNNRTAVFAVRSVIRGYINDKEDRLSQLGFKTPACQNMSSGAEELK
jgi:hypothetical protein